MTYATTILKLYSFLFHLALSIFFISIAIIAQSNNQLLHLEMLPFDQSRLISRVTLLSLCGFISIFLAIVRIYEFVFPLWNIAFVVILVWGFFFTAYTFSGPGGLERALFYIFLAILALLGSLLVLAPRRRNRY